VSCWSTAGIGSVRTFLTDPPGCDLTLEVSSPDLDQLNTEQRKEAAAWLEHQIESAPKFFQPVLRSMLTSLAAGQVSKRQFNTFSRELARALGIIPSSERRKSGNPLGGLGLGARRKPRSERERVEQQRDRCSALMDHHGELRDRHQTKLEKLNERLKKMGDEADKNMVPEADFDIPLEEIELSEEAKAKNKANAAAATDRMMSGDGPDPALRSVAETLMNAAVVTTCNEQVGLDANLPDGVNEENVVKTMTETRVRYDFSLAVTRVELDVEKKVVVHEDGTRQVYSASTSEFGPPRYTVTWGALATLAVLIGQFAMPFNRLATMLSTAAKQFTAGSLSRMAHYVAERLLPIYLLLADELSDSAIFAGDDTPCRVVEVASYFSRPPSKKGEQAPPPWNAYRTAEQAEKSYALHTKMKEELLKLREEGDREAKRASLPEPPLSLLIGRELDFESPRRDGKGAKRSLNTTVVTGRSVADDPDSTIVFYRSHLGSLGNLLEMLLRRRNAGARRLVVQSDLSTTNLVSDPELNKRFDIEMCGCAYHARRPFALYEDQDPAHAEYMLHLFSGLALHERLLDECGRNRDNVLAVRGTDSRALWKDILELAKRMAQRWSKATPLGNAVQYIITHFKKLTAYLENPQIEMSNNLRERLLRTEKLIEKSSMFRRTIEGRAVLDILRTVLQTAVAAGVPAQEYLVDVMRADPEEVAAHPELYTPRGWRARHADTHSAPDGNPVKDPRPAANVAG